jgi:mannose-6-phosphate isomerase-like protein (cupin superfamily)
VSGVVIGQPSIEGWPLCLRISAKERGVEMTLYRWDSVERKFTPTSFQNDSPPGKRVLMKRLRVGKGQRIRAEVATGELFIRVLEGAWVMQIANSQLTVRHNEGVIIPSGFSHSAEAIEDSFALQMSDEQSNTSDDSLWAV